MANVGRFFRARTPVLIHGPQADFTAVPSAPIIGPAEETGNTSALVNFIPPASNGQGAIIRFRVTSTPSNITAEGTATPIPVTGLTEGESYTFHVVAINIYGSSAASAESNTVVPGTPITLASLLAEAGAADWDISVAASLKQNSDGSGSVVNGDPVGYIADQAGHGLHLVQATAGKRMTKSARGGDPMVQAVVADDTHFTLHAAMQNQTGYTLAFVSMHGAQCYTWDPSTRLPYCQFMRAIVIPRIVTAEEKAVILAELSGIVDTTHDLEVGDVGDFSPTSWYAGYYGVIADYDATGATVTFDFQTSANAGPFPPWTYYGYAAQITGRTPREYADSVISVDASLTSFGIGYLPCDVHAAVHDLTQWPALKSYVLNCSAVEGQIPPVSEWPANIQIFRVGGTPELQFGPSGRLPDFTQRPSLVSLMVSSGRISGPLPADMSPMVNLRILHMGANRLSGNIPSLAACVALTVAIFDINSFTGVAPGFALPSNIQRFDVRNNSLNAAAINAILAALVAANATPGSGFLKGYAMEGNTAPTGQGLTDKATLQGRGWTVTTD